MGRDSGIQWLKVWCFGSGFVAIFEGLRNGMSSSLQCFQDEKLLENMWKTHVKSCVPWFGDLWYVKGEGIQASSSVSFEF